MNSTSKRHKGSDINTGIDRLTQLPDDILVRILTFLPILDAVRTVSIRRFGSLWTLLPSLKFHDSEFLKQENWRNKKIDYDDYTPRFADFVRNVLFLHKRVSIDIFELCLESIMVDDNDSISLEKEVLAWIRFAVNRQVKDLYIGAISDEIDYGLSLPRCVFKSQFLVKLKLAHIQINELNQVQMGSLRILSLKFVEATNEVVEKIILGCPSLQELALVGVVGLDELLLNAPTIKKLKLAEYHGLIGCPNLQVLEIEEPFDIPVQVVGVSSIREVNIYGYYSLDTFEGYLKNFSKVDVFKYSDVELESSKLRELDPPQTRWKSLHIKTHLNDDRLLSICNVLRRSPNLEELIVYDTSYSPVGVLCQLTSSRSFNGLTVIEQSFSSNNVQLPSCLMQQLKSVTMHASDVCSHCLLQLAKVLLKSSVTLEKMVILPSKKKSAADNEVKVSKQLLSFSRASTNAKVIYGSE